MQSWQTDTRYYTAEIARDLLGDLVLIRRWGGRWNRRGGEAIEPVRDLAQGQEELARIARRRVRRGYRPVPRRALEGS